jgi:hypothetical protein
MHDPKLCNWNGLMLPRREINAFGLKGTSSFAAACLFIPKERSLNIKNSFFQKP